MKFSGIKRSEFGINDKFVINRKINLNKRMKLAEILKDSNYKLTQFNLVEIQNIKKSIHLDM